MKLVKRKNRLFRVLSRSKYKLTIYALFAFISASVIRTAYLNIEYLLNYEKLSNKYNTQMLKFGENFIACISFENKILTYSYLIFILMLFVMFFLPNLRVLVQMKKHEVEDAHEYGAYGTSHFATKKDVKENPNFHLGKNNPDFGVFLGEYDNKEFTKNFSSKLNNMTVVVAGPGSGKTEAFAIPQILNNTTRTIIATSGKTQLYRRTSKAKSADGYRIIYLDFIKFSGNHFNYLDGMKGDGSLKFATNLVESSNKKDGENVWSNQAISLLSSCIEYVLEKLPEEYKNMENVVDFLSLPEEEVKSCFEVLDDSSQAKRYFSDVKKYTGKMWDSILLTASSVTRLWKNPQVCNFTRDSDFKITDLGTEKVALYLRMHPTDKTYRPLVNSFFRMMFNTLIDEVDEQTDAWPIAMDFVEDEFANIGKIDNYENIKTFGRQMGMNLMEIIQDPSQLEEIYNKNNANTIISSSDNFIFLGTNSPDTAKSISEQIGDTTIRIRNDQEKNDIQKSLNDGGNLAPTGRRLLFAHEITQLDDTEGIYIAKGTSPIKFKKAMAYENGVDDCAVNWHLTDEQKERSNATNTRYFLNYLPEERERDFTEAWQQQDIEDNYFGSESSESDSEGNTQNIESEVRQIHVSLDDDNIIQIEERR